jgi:outer membrane protein
VPKSFQIKLPPDSVIGGPDQYNLTAAQNNLRTNIVNLKQILQLPSNYDFQIVKPDTILVDDQLQSLQEVQNLAQTQRPEVNSELNLKIQIRI